MEVRILKKCIVIILLLMILPVVAWAEEPSNAELYQMIKKTERKVDAAIGETNKAKAEAKKAKEEAAKAKEELLQIKKASTVVPAKALAAKPSDDQSTEKKPGLNASIDLVYLRPSRSNLDFAIVDATADGRVSGDFLNIEPGYQAGLKHNINYDFGNGTDIHANYLKLNTKDSRSATRPPGGRLWGTWLHASSIIDDDDVTSTDATYNFNCEIFDIGLGTLLDIGKNINIKIGAGMRHAKMTQDLDITYQQDLGGGLIRIADIYTSNDFSGWGTNVKIGLDWQIGHGFNIFSSLAGSLLIGDFDMSYTQIDTDSGASPVERINTNNTIDNSIIPVIEMRVGVGYLYQMKNEMIIGAKLGYDWQNWFNMVTTQRFTDDVDAQLMSTDTTDIGLSGFFIQGFIKF
jgi:major outer membrane protein